MTATATVNIPALGKIDILWTQQCCSTKVLEEYFYILLNTVDGRP